MYENIHMITINDIIKKFFNPAVMLFSTGLFKIIENIFYCNDIFFALP